MKKADIEPIPTRVAYAGWEDHRHFGYSVFGELLGEETYTGLMALAVSGRRLSKEGCEVLDDISAILTVAEPRIWPVKATRLVASYGSIISAFAVGNLCIEGDVIGPWTSKFAAYNLIELNAALATNHDKPHMIRAAVFQLLKKKQRLVGFGVPFRPRDERLCTLSKCVEKRGRAGLPYWRLQESVVSILRKERGLEPNIGLGIAAVCLDLGFQPEEISPLAIFINQNAFVANAIEGSKQTPEVLRCLPKDCIEYVGKPPRKSPRAIEKERQ